MVLTWLKWALSIRSNTVQGRVVAESSARGGRGFIQRLPCSCLELHSLDDLSEPAEPAQPSPAGFRALAELEHHGEHGVAAQAAPGRPGPVADRGQGRLDRVGGANALPVLGREVEEVHQLLAIPDQLHRGLGILLLVAGQETVEGPANIILHVMTETLTCTDY